MRTIIAIRPATRRRLSRAVPAAICAAAAIAACGSSGRRGEPSTTRDPAVAYARCLRGHGVPSFPDPRSGDPLRIPSDISAQSPAFKHAQTACARLEPGGESSGRSSESQRLELLNVARCMRAHGVPDFPDPSSSPPPPADGNAIGGDGVYLAVGPPVAQRAPAFTRAATACHLP
jgi:hypothetical protein